MRQIQLLTFLLFLTVTTFAQTKTTKTYYPNGVTQSITYVKADRSDRTILFYPSGKLKQEINLQDNQWFGRQIEYDSSGRKSSESFIIGVDQIPYKLINDTGRNDIFLDAISKKETNYFPNGKKKSEGYYINACKAGLWTYYNVDGTINDTKFYKTLTINE